MLDISDQIQTESNNYLLEESNYETLYHILLPRKSRMSLLVSVPNIYLDNFDNSIRCSLNITYPDSYIYILEIKKEIDETSSNIFCTVVYINITKELIYKLLLYECYKCKFYVGLSENEQEVSILNSPPLNIEIAFTNYQGNEVPYESDIIDIMTIE